MPKYWGKQIFAHGEKREKKKERLKVGNNNGQYLSPEPILQGLRVAQGAVTECWP